MAKTHAQVGTAIGSGQTVRVDAHGECRDVSNPASGTRMVFASTATEWQSFIDNPNGLTMAACQEDGSCLYTEKIVANGCVVSGDKTVAYPCTGPAMSSCNTAISYPYNAPMPAGTPYRLQQLPTPCPSSQAGLFRVVIYENDCSSVPADCTTPWGNTVAHGEAITAYQAATVPYGSTCINETRTCMNGELSGNYKYHQCDVAPQPAAGVWADAGPLCIGIWSTPPYEACPPPPFAGGPCNTVGEMCHAGLTAPPGEGCGTNVHMRFATYRCQ